ncbi:LacI family DNA-binding transcriptional regulator [Marivita sp. S0852]|uniref:LacI family DNA-binding transcriptional regulator n=1 Tax=Marivita sp. S0852 TaxID=3373893 RepID=UPI003982B602
MTKPRIPSDRPDRARRATLRDVAQLSGVSEISVSRVMRDAPSVSERLRARVLAAANEVGYTPNRLAGALKTRSSNLVAVIVPSIGNGVFPEVLNGIESVLTHAGLQPVLGITQYDRTREVQVLRDMLAWSPMGVIMAGTDHEPAVARMIETHHVPVVEFMDIDRTPIHMSVGISNVAAAVAVADLLFQRGYRRPGYIGAWAERPDRSKARRLAFEARLVELGIPLVDKEIAQTPASAEVGAQTTEILLSRSPDIDVIFFANDDQALGALFHCQRTGRKVPQDVGLIGFNGIDIGLATPTILASVVTPRYQMGVETARLLLAAADDPESKQVVDLGFEIRLGESL